jgi:hypothetical protein
MKKRLLTGILGAFLTLGSLTICGEEIKTYGNDYPFYNQEPLERETVYNKVIRNLRKSKNLKDLKKRVTWETAIDFIELYPDTEEKVDYSQYEKVGNLELFSKCFEAKLNENPFDLFERRGEYRIYHHRGEEGVGFDEFPYEEQAWGALGSTLRRKYAIVRIGDKCVKKVRDSTTIKCETDYGTAKVRPSIEKIGDTQKMGVRIFVFKIPFFEIFEAKLMAEKQKVSFGKRNFYLDYSFETKDIKDGRKEYEKTEQKALVRYKIFDW